jgi:hypothetical protein
MKMPFLVFFCLQCNQEQGKSQATSDKKRHFLVFSNTNVLELSPGKHP